jgi:hypothetical protein
VNWQDKILNEPRLGFVKEHGSKRRPVKELRPTIVAGDKLKDDYSVFHKDRHVGRIRLADERTILAGHRMDMEPQPASPNPVMVKWHGC